MSPQDVQAAFRDFGPVQCRRMFGGLGVFHDGLMLGLVAGGGLFLKVDEQTEPAFAARGLPRFAYLRAGRPCTLGFCAVPAEFFEDPAAAARWAVQAYGVAVRAQADRARPRSAGRHGASPPARRHRRPGPAA